MERATGDAAERRGLVKEEAAYTAERRWVGVSAQVGEPLRAEWERQVEAKAEEVGLEPSAVIAPNRRQLLELVTGAEESRQREHPPRAVGHYLLPFKITSASAA